MMLLRSPHEWANIRARFSEKETLGFVPTMGALHEGHLSLVQTSLKENSKTLVSIFINPTQFNNKEDLNNYPKTFDEDLKLLEQAGVSYVFSPSYEDLYPDNYTFRVRESELSHELCGAHRPGHFDGVLTVMTKLLNIAQAHRCYMGEKDYQQLFLVKKMTEAFFMKTEIIACPTKREASGLALSSRNLRLSEEGRKKASLLYKILTKTITEQSTPADCRVSLENAGFEVDYVKDLWGRRFVAASLENIRLIDNAKIN